MATDKRAITAYLPDDIEEKLIKYCEDYNITRKDKEGNDQPSLGTGIVELLKIVLNQDNVPSPVEGNVNIDIEALEKNITDTLLGKLPEYIDSNVKGRLPDTQELEGNLKQYIDSILPSAIPDIDARIEQSEKECQEYLEQHLKSLKGEIEQLKKPLPSLLMR